MKANIYFDANKYNVSFDNQKYKFYFDSTIEGITPSGTLTITSNGTYDVTNYASAEVSTGSATYQSKSVTPSETAQTVTPDSGYDGLSSVEVGAISSNYVGSQITRQTALTVNDKTVTAQSGYYENAVSLTVTLNNQTKTATPTQSTQTITPDSGYDGLSEVTVNPIPSQYIVPSGSVNITQNGTVDVTNYASAIVNVSASGEWSSDGIAKNTEPSGTITLSASVTAIATYAFAYKPITSISADYVTAINSYAFFGSGLTSLKLPNANGASNYVTNMCQNCKSLATVVLPSWSNAFYTQCFEGCTALTAFDVPASSIGGSYVFRNCTSLSTIILRKASVVTLNNINHFNGTPFASGGSGGTIYVPSALISSYQTATNWSTLYGYGTVTFAAIESSQYKNYYADGTAIS